MEKKLVVMILQERAHNHKYNTYGELAGDCFEIGASYSVLAWMDKYCLEHDLYRETDYS
jgi:hypothetical protein